MCHMTESTVQSLHAITVEKDNWMFWKMVHTVYTINQPTEKLASCNTTGKEIWRN